MPFRCNGVIEITLRNGVAGGDDFTKRFSIPGHHSCLHRRHANPCRRELLRHLGEDDFEFALLHVIATSLVVIRKQQRVRRFRYAHVGEPDYYFNLDFTNHSGVEHYYTITYIAENHHGLTTITTTDIRVSPQ